MSLVSFMQRLLESLRGPLIRMSLYGIADMTLKALFRPYTSGTAIYNATPTVNTEVAVDVSAIVPGQAIAVKVCYDFTSGATATVLELYPVTGETAQEKKVIVGGQASLRSVGQVDVALDSAKKFYIKETGAGVATKITWTGWYEYGTIKQPLNIPQF